MRRMTYFVMALALVLGFTQCKKEQLLEPQGGQVGIILDVNNGNNNGSRAEVVPPSVNFETGDQILVASNGHYVGTLTYNGTNFSGNITNPVENEPLYFYFLGNNAVLGAANGNGDITSCTVDISNQTNYPRLPVISMGVSIDRSLGNEIVYYQTGKTSYEAQLHNKCSLMKFNVTTSSNANICITGMNNKVIVNFADRSTNDGFSYCKEGEGVIKMKGGNSSPVVTWAIVLPQDASPEARSYTDDYAYIGTRPAMAQILADQYLQTGFAMEVNTEFNPYTTPLTFEAKTAWAEVSLGANGPWGIEPPTVDVEYSKNGGAWTPYTDPITLSKIGDKVSFRGNNAKYFPGNQFSCSGGCYIYGNIMSLVSSEGYATATTLTEEDAFSWLFSENSSIYNHESKTLVLPATTLSAGCYYSMFYECTNLTTAPELPARTLATNCYYQMFQHCSRLTTVPELPAEVLAEGCYKSMFWGCTSLTTAPTLLPVMTLASSCYGYMFYGCTSLTSAPTLPATTLASSCYASMFSGCSSLTTVPSSLPATTLVYNCYSYMFNGCTNLTTAPELPATTLAGSCYESMFKGCTSLTSAPLLPAATLYNYCYRFMFQNCSNLKSITCLATNISATNCTTDWLSGVAATGTFTKAASMTSWGSGASGIPSGWTVNEQ